MQSISCTIIKWITVFISYVFQAIEISHILKDCDSHHFAMTQMFLITSVSMKILYFDTKNAKPAGYQFLQTIPKTSSTQTIVTDFLFLEKIQEIV